MATTKENLETAFAGESQANRKYTAFARKAEKDGFPHVAKLFKATAEAETIHALGHFDALDGVQSTAENLETAIGGETYEFTEMYPPMLKQAEADDHKAKKMFKFALSVERIHAAMYTKALEAVKAGKDLDVAVYLCPVCGNIEFENAPDSCSVCGLPGEKFVQY